MNTYSSHTRSLSLPHRQGKCRMSVPGELCEVGLRRKTYYVLSGSVLGVWSHIEDVFNRHSSGSHRVQIVRVRTDTKRLVGELKWLNSLSLCRITDQRATNIAHNVHNQELHIPD